VIRRDFIRFLAMAGAASPFAARAQEPGRVYRLGVLDGSRPEDAQFVALFDELRRAGFVEGQNLHIEGYFSARDEEAPGDASAIVAAGVDAILVTARLGRPVQRATRTIPILAVGNDLVRQGFVSSLAHPGGNTTGISILGTELDGKRQELLMGLVPGARHIAVLADPAVSVPERLQALQEMARARGVELSVHRAAKPEDIVPAVDAAKGSGAQALNVLASALFVDNRRLIVERTAAVRLPAMYQWPGDAEAGGLVAYGARLTEIYRQRARQLVKIFGGAKAADIPVEQPTEFELVINLNTAKALGLTIPEEMLDRADKVIE
jgi:putative ABC transport system substrate-binding protein